MVPEFLIIKNQQLSRVLLNFADTGPCIQGFCQTDARVCCMCSRHVTNTP